MNEISFVIAPDDFGIGICDAVEPVIDGVSMVDLVKHAEGEVLHQGLTDVERALQALGHVPPPGTAWRVRVLGCLCGIDGCSNVRATVSASPDAVTWSDFDGHFRAYSDVGPFVFNRAHYSSSAASPVRAEHPVREGADVDQLAAAMPRDHAAWLRAMTMAFGRNFFTPFEPDLPRQVAAQGVRAFAEAGMPVREEAVREWARGRRFDDDAIEQYVAWFNDLT
jgi:hypothetical protein